MADVTLARPSIDGNGAVYDNGIESRSLVPRRFAKGVREERRDSPLKTLLDESDHCFLRQTVMRRRKHLILGGACVVAVAFCALMFLQAAGAVRPLGVGWGDGRVGRAYSVEFDGLIVVRTAAGMTTPPGGSYVYAVESLERWAGGGVSYHRWDMTAGRPPRAPVLGRFVEVRVGVGWPVVVAMGGVGLWVMLWVKESRRLARTGGRCRECGYDLRATPERCPECGVEAEGRRQGRLERTT